MNFRMRRRKQSLGYKDISEKPPVEIIAVTNAAISQEDQLEQERRALQKVFASKLVKLSKKHLSNNDQKEGSYPQTTRRASTGDVAVMSADAQHHSKMYPKEKPPIRRIRSELPQSESESPFRLACGGNEDVESDIDGKNDAQQQQSSSHYNNGGRSSVPCSAPPKVIRCSGGEESSLTMPTFSPHCFVLGDWCPTTLFRAGAENDGTDSEVPCWDSPLHFVCRILKGRHYPATRKGNTKKNGIPKVISVPTGVGKSTKKTNNGFCGCMQDNSVPTGTEGSNELLNSHSLDSSLIRLEDTLMKANLNADTEDKYEKPMHEPDQRGGRADHVDNTADATTITSSLSTHSSFKVGASIIRLPDTMAPMV